ncbi:MAG: T9SS type A sorting domain-containing protein [Candidatus Fermentibacteraceae bacterium]|nr:T9SS type A sorting domain-containing protein [Candidatus Fermentibacteraceae bacterium]MBN2607914.1 T9SS type A sorting domain-containing protein [Candidatus Fermentibacteraceae bacterium]
MCHILSAALLCLLAASIASADVCGSIEYAGNIRILNLWGSWDDMGYAHGYLLGPDISEVFHKYFLEMAGGPGNFESARIFFLAYFEVPEDFIDYTQGMISGIADTISLYSPQLGRNIDYIDICVVSSIPDIAALKGEDMLLCSSVSAWGEATETDPVLSGAPAISRNLDYYVDTGGMVLDHSILLTFEPENGQDWIAVGFPGFAGCLSGMNESGVSACLNMGNHQGTSQYTSPFVPICMAQALGLMETDFNGSGSCNIEDMKDALTQWNRGNSFDIHVVADRDLAGQDSNAVVVEVSNMDGYAFRYSYHETAIAPCRMILTNHHRVLIPPVGCYRYSYLMDSLTTNPDVNLDRLWKFMGAVGWPATPGAGGTIQTMVFMPEQLRTGLAFASLSTPAYEQDPEWIDWADIFPNHTPQGIGKAPAETHGMVIYPNPSSGTITILSPTILSSVMVFDISGRIMQVSSPANSSDVTLDLSMLPQGLYRIQTISEEGTNSRELVVIHN